MGRKAAKVTMGKAVAATLLIGYCESRGYPVPDPEHAFAGLDGSRKWRFDLGWPDHKIALEIDGLFSDDGAGNKVAGRHARPDGHEADCAKLTEAQLDGWLVLVLTTRQVEDGLVYRYLDAAFKGWVSRPRSQ